MVKNYLVCAIRPIKEGWHLEKRQDLFEKYHEMYAMRLASFKKFVQEPFEPILWTDTVANNDEYTEANWIAIKELWHQEPCNIFWSGADTLMIQPTSLFGEQFKEYRMFNYTDPRSHREFEHHFNDDIQYYPHTMSAETWTVGETYWAQRENHPDRHWGFDQLRHNAMFWSQDIDITNRLYPTMAYQAMNLRNLNNDVILAHNTWNQIDINHAHILHFHASRGSQAVIDLMKILCTQLDITL
jgi:hypothetical protein